MNTFDLSRYAVNEEDSNQPSQFEETPAETSKQVDLEKYASKEPESNLEAAGRHLYRGASRVAETALGLPGDTLRLAENLVFGGYENLTGADLSEFRRSLEDTAAFKILPSSSQLRGVQKEASGGMTEPTPDSFEKDVDDSLKLATSFLMGGAGVARSLASALFGKGASKIAKEFGADEFGQNAVELGTSFLAHNLNPGVAKRAKDNLYKAADNAIPSNTMVQTESYANNLDKLSQVLDKGAPTATKDAVMKVVNHLQKRSKGGAIEVEELVQAYRDINQTLNSKKLFEELGTTQSKILRSQFEDVKGVIRKSLEDYGQHNPEFYKYWTQGNAANAAIAKSESMKNWLKSNINHFSAKLAGGVALEALMGYPEAAVATALGAGAGYGANRIRETVNRFMRSPVLRKAYLDAMKNAADHNLPATVQSLERLEKLDKIEQAKRVKSE